MMMMMMMVEKMVWGEEERTGGKMGEDTVDLFMKQKASRTEEQTGT
jgi:hypothetical protein